VFGVQPAKLLFALPRGLFMKNEYRILTLDELDVISWMSWTSLEGCWGARSRITQGTWSSSKAFERRKLTWRAPLSSWFHAQQP
jgi:hypothetical protein